MALPEHGFEHIHFRRVTPLTKHPRVYAQPGPSEVGDGFGVWRRREIVGAICEFPLADLVSAAMGVMVKNCRHAVGMPLWFGKDRGNRLNAVEIEFELLQEIPVVLFLAELTRTDGSMPVREISQELVKQAPPSFCIAVGSTWRMRCP
jgi:hypothetical protein